MEKIYILDAKRTPIGKFLGKISTVTSSELAAAVIKDILTNTKININDIDEVILGNVLSAGQSQGIGRQASIKAGIPESIPGYSINMICGSGMKAIMTAYQAIKSGESNLILAGGSESMSQAPFLNSSTMRKGVKMGATQITDHIIVDALSDAFSGEHMGITAENIVEKYNISREAQDEFAFQSQLKAIKALDNNKFFDEIVPIQVKDRKGITTITEDEFVNRNTSLEKLKDLRPAFKKNGSVTAGNSSGINDGASILLIASEAYVKKHNLTPLVEIIAIGQGGVNPDYMGLGPIPAIENVLKKSNLDIKDMGLIELNEAFAGQSLGVLHELKMRYNIENNWFENKLNVNGGAIAIGHPVGASGSRIITTLVHEMKREKIDLGLASLCIGGGMGTAIIVKNIIN